MQVDVPKAADFHGWERIIRPSRGMRAGLKILVSAVPRLRRYEPRIRLSDLRDWVDADEPIPLSNSQLHVRDPLA